MHVLLTGATGFIGSALLRRLRSQGYTVSRLTRKPATASTDAGPGTTIVWNPHEELSREALDALADLDAVVHLAGEPIAARRWSETQKRKIRDSRVLVTRRLVDSLSALDAPPRTFICASAVGYYGDRGDDTLDEQSSPGTDFLAQVCQDWEAEARRAEAVGMRSVQLRIGMVLGPGGGALPRMLLPFRLGLGGRLGSGQQWMAWIHRDDVVRLVQFLLEDGSTVQGPINATAPQPVRNSEFTQALGRALGRPAFLAVPDVALKLALGEMSQLLLASQRVVPKAALNAGFTFQYTDVENALASCLQ